MEKQNVLIKWLAFGATFLLFKGVESILSVGCEVMKHASKRVQRELN